MLHSASNPRRRRAGIVCRVCSALHETRTRVSQISDLKKEFQALTSQRHRSAHLPRCVRKSAQPKLNCSRSQETAALLLFLLPPALHGGRWFETLLSAGLWLSHPVLLSCGRSEPEPRVTHEARGRSQDGSVQEAVEGEEADRRGVHPTVPASPAAHPPHQREYKQN